MNSSHRIYHHITHKEAVLRVCCDKISLVTEEIIYQRKILEDYIKLQPEFLQSFKPLELRPGAPESARRMAAAATKTGLGPMASVAGVMAQLAGEKAMKSGEKEVIIENGGDLFFHLASPATIGIYTGIEKLAGKLAFAIEAENTPLSICASSGKMGHSTSLGDCNLAVVSSRDAALADSAATLAANRVKRAEDMQETAEYTANIEGVLGVMLFKDELIAMAGTLPPLIKA
ncbi:MAG: UPF0280 family protein [Fibrobacteria bacterium]|nr:UPF0280 family protein [Fibrobacteria bacterium]